MLSGEIALRNNHYYYYHHTHVFKIVAVIQSGPSGAPCGSCSFKSFTIPSAEIWIGSTDLVDELFIVGKLLQSPLVKTD